MKKTILVLSVLPLLLWSCEPISILRPGDDSGDKVERHTARTLTFSATDTAIHQCQTTYSLNLLKQVGKNTTGNFMISPISAEMVLAMLMNGAQENTQSEIIAALQMNNYTVPQINDYHQKMILALPFLDTQTQIKISNALWLCPQMAVKSAFLNTTKQSYLALVDTLDLANPSSADVINHWADTATNHLIKEVIGKGDMNKDLRMVIANALYFKGFWSVPFVAELTTNEDFTREDASVKSAPIMHQQGKLLIAPADKAIPASFLRLYYEENKYCMDILLPEGNATANQILQGLTVTQLDSLLSKAHFCEVDLKLPRFEAKYSRNLNADMKALGIDDIFTTDADLSAISEAENLYLSLLKQMTYIKVDEKGTEAAAVTIGMVGTTSIQEPKTPIPFYATRPFVYMIRDVEHGTILFAGIFAEP